MMRLFSPRKTTLLFVIRDKSRVCFHFFNTNIHQANGQKLISFAPFNNIMFPDTFGEFGTYFEGRYWKGI